MVWMIPRNGPPVRAGRYLGFDGEVMADVLLAEGEVRHWNSLDPPPARGFLDLGPSTTVLPGLVDCHVHLALPPPRLGDDPLEIMAARLARCLEYGLVAVRDGGDRLGATLELQKEKDLPAWRPAGRLSTRRAATETSSARPPGRRICSTGLPNWPKRAPATSRY